MSYLVAVDASANRFSRTEANPPTLVVLRLMFTGEAYWEAVVSMIVPPGS